MTHHPHLLIADGHGLAYQAFYALPPMHAPDGRATQIVYGVLSSLFRMLKAHRPDALVVAFDAKGPTFRHLAYQDYKIHRAPAPEGLHDQVALLKEALDALGIARCELQGYEADDLLGTLASQAVARGYRVTLLTSDKDAFQLLSDRVSVYDLRKDRRIGPPELMEDKGLRPEQVPDFLALAGDSSDNVPGVAGVGAKTAQKLLASAGSLEALLRDPAAHAKGRVAEALVRDAELARTSLALATLDLQAPVAFDPEASRTPAALSEPGRGMLLALGFQRLTDAFPASGAPAEAPAPAAVEATAFRKASAKDLKALSGPCGIEPLRHGDFSGFALDAGEGDAVVVEAAKLPGGIALVGHDLKACLLEAGPRELRFDTLLAAYLLDPEGSHRLEDLARELLGRSLPLPPGKKEEKAAPETFEAAAARAAARARAARELEAPLSKRLGELGLDRLMREIELPLVPILAGMEREGIGLDLKALAALSKDLEGRLAGLEASIHQAAGEPFNINSPKQLGHVLFEVLALPHGRKGKTGYSTDADVLADLSAKHPLPRQVLEYRQLEKLKNTYVDALPELVGPDGRLHTSFNQAVAATGRLSSSRPNLQNIPVRNELGRRIRAAFLPHGPGDVLLTADYSQIELRVLAHCSGDEALCGAFARGEDVHAMAAAQIHGVPLSGVTDEMRGFAKTVNFSVIYGKTAFTLARDLGRPVKEAQAFIDAYFRTFSGVKAFVDRTVAEARERGFVATLTGRRRPIPFLASPNPAQRAAAERVAVNTVIQGSAADLMKIAMIRADAALAKAGLRSRILLQIHDELILNVPRKEEAAVRSLVAEAMTGAMTLKVPLAVNTAAGETWREAA